LVIAVVVFIMDSAFRFVMQTVILINCKKGNG